MATPHKKASSADALSLLSTVVLAAFVIAALYFARDILIPIALSVLLTFLLTPVVTRLERWVGRIAAVLLVVAMIFAATAGAGWILTRQLIDLATKLPEYKENIVTKLHAIKAPKDARFAKISQTVDELKKELPGGGGPETPTVTKELGKPHTSVASPPAELGRATPVQVVESTKASPIELAESVLAPVLGPLGTAALVLLLVICMLFQREDLRNRLIRLAGQGRISATTRAMDDAGQRVSRYLLMQFIVNLTYGICVSIGLWFIGVPNALLWGAFGFVLRFIPYVGPWVALIFPTVLSLAISPHWTMPVLTVSLFAGLELILNNVMEPLLYGKHTGTSSVALIVAAVFWTWLWGPLGLVLATPMTVCVVVLGRYVPRLSFLSVLLSDEDALTTAEDCYHRLLTPGEDDEIELVESYLKTNPLDLLYDTVFIPVLITAETDARQDSLDQDRLILLEQSMRDIIDDQALRSPAATPKSTETGEESAPTPLSMPPCRVFCLPARAERDELAGVMLTTLLQQKGCEAACGSGKMTTGELLGQLEQSEVDVACISVVSPSTIIHARYLCLKIHTQFPTLKIVIGLWGSSDGTAEAAKRLKDSGADVVVFSLAEAIREIAKLAPPPLDSVTASPVPADEEVRLEALQNLKLLDTDAEPIFDRITTRVARVFDVPIALLTLIDRDRQFFKSQTGLPEDLAKARQTPRETSVCGHLIASNELLVVEDLVRDRRFAGNVGLKERGFRFYAGVPLRAPGGQPIGSLCLLDIRPRQFSTAEKRQLQEYANDIMEEFVKRAERMTAEASAEALPTPA